MNSVPPRTRFSRDLLVSAILVLLLAGTFALYVESRERVARAHEQRYRSYLLADELRQSGDDLTRMVRTYVVTGDPFYKQHYQDILAIRDGTKPRPENYGRPYWDLALPDGPPPRPDSAQAVPLLELMRQAGFTEEEFRKVAEAKANSDALTLPEMAAMRLIEAGGTDVQASRAQATGMLYDRKYHQAKESVMRPIHDFFVRVDERTLATVLSAEKRARALRFTFIVIGAAVIFMLWRTYVALGQTLGASVGEVAGHLAKMGSGDFSAAIPVRAGLEKSVLGWVAATQAKLNDIDRERKRAEAALRHSELRFRQLAESLPQFVWTCQPDGPCDYLSPKWVEFTGVPEAEQLGFGWLDQIHPDDRERLNTAWNAATASGSLFQLEFRIRRHDGVYGWFDTRAVPLRDDSGRITKWVGSNTDITERKQSEAALQNLEWMMTKRPVSANGATERVGQAYGDVTELNTERTILDAVGPDLLRDIVGDYMNLLETSSAVYEKNGDYAFGIFSSGWCQAMDMASFRNCGTNDNREALRCGQWHCHESCWNEASRKSIETNQPNDIQCQGGIRLHAVPIHAGDEIVGSINFGYGDPPRDPARLQELAAKYGLTVAELERNAAAYERRPPFIIELAKERLLGSARLIGEIVQRKRAEQHLSASERRFRTIFDQVPVSIWEEDWSGIIGGINTLRAQGVVDFQEHFRQHPDQVAALLREVRVVDVNPETVTMFGAADKADLLRSLEIVFATPDTLPGFVGELVALGAGHPMHRAEMALRTVQGRLITVLLTMFFPNADSEPGTVLVSLMDITDRKRAEEDIRLMNNELESRVAQRTAALETSNKELEAFSYSISHDLRSPLRAINGYSRILVEDYRERLDDEGRRVLGVVGSEAQRMGRLVDELLNFARVGRQKMEPRAIDMRELAETTFAEARALEPERKITLEIGTLPLADGEPALLRQVWANLLTNAVKFTRQREAAKIEVGATRGEGETTYFVRDNGAGFDMAHVGKLFGVFQRLHGEAEFEGTGVGLAFVKRIIQRHGGRVWAEGALDRGATFYFALPDAPQPATAL